MRELSLKWSSLSFIVQILRQPAEEEVEKLVDRLVNVLHTHVSDRTKQLRISYKLKFILTSVSLCLCHV